MTLLFFILCAEEISRDLSTNLTNTNVLSKS